MMMMMRATLLLTVAGVAVAARDHDMKSAAKLHRLVNKAFWTVQQQGVSSTTEQAAVDNTNNNYNLRHLSGMDEDETCMSDLVSCQANLGQCKAEVKAPKMLYVQMANSCKLTRSDDRDKYELRATDMDDETYAFSDRPFEIEQEVSTRDFFDTFDTLFATSPPNAAVTFRHAETDQFEGPLVAVQVSAAYLEEEDVYVYELEQSESQASVHALDDFFDEGSDEVLFEDCSLFIDSSAFPNAGACSRSCLTDADCGFVGGVNPCSTCGTTVGAIGYQLCYRVVPTTPAPTPEGHNENFPDGGACSRSCTTDADCTFVGGTNPCGTCGTTVGAIGYQLCYRVVPTPAPTPTPPPPAPTPEGHNEYFPDAGACSRACATDADCSFVGGLNPCGKCGTTIGAIGYQLCYRELPNPEHDYFPDGGACTSSCRTDADCVFVGGENPCGTCGTTEGAVGYHECFNPE